MDRQEIYDQADVRAYDHLWAWRLALRGLAVQMQDALGGSASVVSGLNASATGPTSLSVNIGGGRIYQLAQTDAAAYGSLTPDTRMIMQQGEWSLAAVTLSTTGLTSGKSRWALIQAQFTQTDLIPGDDPNGGLLPFVNPSNPSGPPWSGPANSGSTLPTRRTGQCTISVVYGTVANTGAEVPPSASAGCVGLYLVDLAFGQTTISTGQILVAGPSVGPNVPGNYPQAPFLAGLLNSHHNGTAGQAPQINLATEVQGLLPAANIANMGDLGGFQQSAISATFASANFGQALRFQSSATGNGIFTLGTPFAGALQWVNNNSPTFNLTCTSGGPTVFFGFIGAPNYSQTAVSSLILPPNSAALLIGTSAGNWQVLYNSSNFSTRTQLLANLNVFVNGSTGSDSNDGLTSGTAFATWQHAWNYVLNNYDLNGFVARITQAGTNTDTLIANGTMVGATTAQSLQLTINGTWAVANGFCLSATGSSFLINGAGTMQASGTGTGQGFAVIAFAGSLVAYQGITFGACGTAHIQVSQSGQVTASGSYSVSGSAPMHLEATFGASVQIFAANITFSGTIAFGTTGVTGFMSASDCASIYAGGLTFSGSVPTGRRYYAANNASLNTNGGGATFLPGNAAGSLVNGGVYS